MLLSSLWVGFLNPGTSGAGGVCGVGVTVRMGGGGVGGAGVAVQSGFFPSVLHVNLKSQQHGSSILVSQPGRHEHLDGC